MLRAFILTISTEKKHNEVKIKYGNMPNEKLILESKNVTTVNVVSVAVINPIIHPSNQDVLTSCVQKTNPSALSVGMSSNNPISVNFISS